MRVMLSSYEHLVSYSKWFLVECTVINSAYGSSFMLYYFNTGCGNTLYYPSSGYVTSPNWPDNYGYNQNCYNVIYGLGRSTFYLNFQSFILQSCCSCDWLEGKKS